MTSDPHHSASPHPEGGTFEEAEQCPQCCGLGVLAHANGLDYTCTACWGTGEKPPVAEAPPPGVPPGGDRPGQADAAVAEAAQALVKRLEFVHAHPAYEGIWTLAHLHGVRYQGPKYDTELSVLKAALHAPKQGEKGDGWRAAAERLYEFVRRLGIHGPDAKPWSERSAEHQELWVAALREAAPPTASPSEGTGEGDVRRQLAAGLNATLDQVAAEVGKTPREVLNHAIAFIRRAPTDAAPAPGRDGESDADFLDRMYTHPPINALSPRECDDMDRLVRLARRTPPAPPASVAGAVRPDDGVTYKQVTAGLGVCLDRGFDFISTDTVREIIEAARCADDATDHTGGL